MLSAHDHPDGPTVVMAPLLRRFFAKLLDGVIIGLPAAIFYAVVHSGKSTADMDINKLTGFVGAVLIVSAVHDFVGVALWGQTLGKYAMGIRVRRAVDGTLPGWSSAGLRVLSATGPQIISVFAVGSPPGLYGLVDNAFGVRKPLHQCLHDRVARTVVVDERAMGPVWTPAAVPPPHPRWDPPPPRSS